MPKQVHTKNILGRFSKMVVLVFVLVAAIVAGGYFVWNWIQENQRVLLTPPPNLAIKTYSLGGKVVSVNSSSIIYKAALVFQTDKGNVVEFQNRTALIGLDTKIEKRTGLNIQVFKLSDIKSDMRVNVYYSSNPFESKELKADRIEVE